MRTARDDSGRGLRVRSLDRELRHEEVSLSTLYRHATKEEWGFGILAWEGHERRRYQFQDGQMRTIGKGHFEKMIEVETPPPNARMLIAELSAGRDVAMARRRLATIDPTRAKDFITFEAQIEFFEREYPQGFQGDRWLTEVRGVGARRALKRHRDPVLAKAGALLDRSVLDAVVVEGRAVAHVDALIDLLGRTDLVRAKGDVSQLVMLRGAERVALLVALRDFLDGETSLATSFDALVSALSPIGHSSPSWPLATILPALATPRTHVPVRAALFRTQSMGVAPDLEHRNTPSGASYLRYLDMAQAIERSLLRRGLTPRDLIDVYDFMSLTLGGASSKKQGSELVALQNGADEIHSPLRGTA